MDLVVGEVRVELLDRLLGLARGEREPERERDERLVPLARADAPELRQQLRVDLDRVLRPVGPRRRQRQQLALAAASAAGP